MKIVLGYIDPGMGLLAWQALVAAFLGTLFYLKKTRAWIVGLFMRLFRANKPPEGGVRPTIPPLK
jgi:hypothetical protein